jgi:hypothetical protein
MKKIIPVSLIQQAAIKKGVAYLKACMNKGKIVGNSIELSLQDYNEIKKSFAGNQLKQQPAVQQPAVQQPAVQEPVKKEAVQEQMTTQVQKQKTDIVTQKQLTNGSQVAKN